MKSLIISFSLVFFARILCAQEISFNWVKQFAGTSEGTGLSITTDANGFVYTTGVFTGIVDFDPGPAVFNMNGVGSGDIFITKLDSSGNLIWAKQMTGNDYCYGNSIAVDAAGNIYITGSFSYGVDFDPGPGEYILATDGRLSFFVVKIDQNGNFAWARQMETGVFTSSVGSSITVDVFGDVLTTGLLSARSRADVFIKKFTPAGILVWTKQLGSETSVSLGNYITTDNAGNIFTCGYFSATVTNDNVDFDPGPGVYNLKPFGGADIFISKLDINGNFIWARQFGGLDYEEANSVAIDNAGNIYFTGYFAGTADFDPGPDVYNLVADVGKDIFVAKINASGNFVWAKKIGNFGLDEGKSLKLDAIGNVYVGGYFSDMVDFDPGPAEFNLSAMGSTDIFLLKLDPSGNFRWAKKMGGEFIDGATNININTKGQLYSTGYFQDIVDFDPGPGVFNLSSNGGKDVFVHKLSLCSNFTFSEITATVCSAYILNGQTYSTSGVHIQVLNNSANCDSVITLNLTVNNRYTLLNVNICEGESYYAAGANQTKSGIYRDSLLTTLGCDSVITTNLTVFANPKPDLGPDRKICTNTPVLIYPGNFETYLWQNNLTGPYQLITQAGKYWVKVTDINNCSATDTLTILAIDTVPKNFLPAGSAICYGNTIKISVPGYSDYLWSNGSTSPNITFTKFGTYYLTVKDFNNCSGIDSIVIKSANCFYIGIPNAFTPNGDALNDIFKPTIFQVVKNFSFVIFNRYGQKVFETTEYGKGWDGTLKGKEQPTGSYVYRIKFTNIFGWESVENGSVLLVR